MDKRQILVVGNGMVGQRFVDKFLAWDTAGTCDITVVGEESRPAYDRVALTSWFNGRTEADLSLVDDALLAGDRVDYRLGQRVVEIDTVSRKATLDDGSMHGYDELVIATGSAPFVPPIPGHDLDGCFVYRTIEDLERIKSWATAPGRATGLVIGGGLLGLEAANALRSLGLDVHVVEMAPYPMPQQLGEGGGRMLGRWVDSLGVQLHCGVAPHHFLDDGSGSVAGLQMSDGTAYPSDIVVFSAGVRPRDDLARRSGIDVGERGGIVVDDTLQTSADHVWAIGEVALHGGRVYGLVAPGYEMAAALAERLADDGGAPVYRGSDLSTKLKLLGVDVASFGQSNAGGDQIDEIVYNDPINKIFRRLALDATTGALLGGAFVGDTSGYELLTAITLGQATQPDDLPAYVLPSSVRPPDQGQLPDGALLCSCNAVSVGTIRRAVADGCQTLGDVKSSTCAGTS
ncbi:MAG: FAD-dependent oxidoreductase, partial [Ilumatobacteraceae bacterium]